MKGFFMSAVMVVMVISTAQAQWSVGPRVSLGTVAQGTHKIQVLPDSDKIPMSLTFDGGSSVQSIGAMAYNKIGPGFLQVEAMATRFNLEFAAREMFRSDLVPQTYNETHVIIEVPIAAGFVVKNIKVGAGPILEINAKKDSELTALEGYTSKAETLEGAFQGLVGFQKGILHIDLKYIYKLDGIVDGFGLGNDVLKLNKSANRAVLSLGLLF